MLDLNLIDGNIDNLNVGEVRNVLVIYDVDVAASGEANKRLYGGTTL